MRPELVVRVRYLEWSDDGHLRFPVYLGIEHDADPHLAIVGPHDETTRAAPLAVNEPAPVAEEITVRVTNRAKIFWPADGTTKGDLVDYYDSIAPTLLPYLADRPVMLVRYPDGIDGKSFYQWNVPHGCPSWIKSVVLGRHVESAQGDEDHKKHVFLIDRPEALRYIANLACIPVHVLASRIVSPRSADFLTIDFDVNLASLETAIPIARTLREVLEKAGLEGFLRRRAGADGPPRLRAARKRGHPHGRTHVRRSCSAASSSEHVTATSRRWSASCRSAVRRSTSTPGRPGGRARSSRRIPSVRHRARACRRRSHGTKSRPRLDPGAFTIRTVPARIASVGDPMAPLLSRTIDLASVLAKLSGRLVAKGAL